MIVEAGGEAGADECQLSVLKFHEEPAPAVDGDAAFIKVGTEVHAVGDFETSCRVAAEIDGANRDYFARAVGGRISKAVPCAQAP